MAIWGSLPGAIGDFAFQAANGLISGVEAMLNGVVTRINNFINGSERRAGPVAGLGGRRRRGADRHAGSGGTGPDRQSLRRMLQRRRNCRRRCLLGRAVADLSRATPDLGLGAMADDARARADGYREAAGMLADAAGRPLASWQALKDAVTGAGTGGRNRAGDAASSADAAEHRTGRHRAAAGSAGAPRATPGRLLPQGPKQATTGWGRRDRHARRLCRQGARHRRRYRQRTGRCLHLGRERRGRVREDRQARLPRSGHLDDRRSGQAGGAALHPRPDRQCAVGRAGRCGWHLRQHPACRWHGRIAGPGPHGPGHGLCRCPAHACGRLGRDQARRGSGDPATRRAGSLAPRGGRLRPRPGAPRPSMSPSWPATPKASGNRARRSRPTSPAPCRSAGGACDGVSRGPVPRQHQPRGARRAGTAHARSSNWPAATRSATPAGPTRRRRYDVAYGIRRADDLAAVVAFFEARNGRLHGFRYKDWADYKSCLPSQAITPTDQPIGTGNGQPHTFQLLKRYTSGAQTWTRTIAKPVAGTVRVALNGVEQMSGWTRRHHHRRRHLHHRPGRWRRRSRAGFEFDVPVRFDTDTLDVTLDLERLGSITSIPLLEIRR